MFASALSFIPIFPHLLTNAGPFCATFPPDSKAKACCQALTASQALSTLPSATRSGAPSELSDLWGIWKMDGGDATIQIIPHNMHTS